MNVIPDTQVAAQFLQRWNPDGPWVLTAIPPEGGMTHTTTAHTAEEAKAWIDARQWKMNMYFQVNLANGNLDSKARKTAISKLYALQVDIDPAAEETPEAAKQRAMAALQAYSPSPTVVVDSGNGVQAFWKLEEPVAHTAEVNTAELESYSRALAKEFGGDHCFNIDRIMRLPGTVNLPSEAKKKKGRVPALSKVLAANWDAAYPLSLFPQLFESAPAKVSATINLPDELPVVDVETLPVSERCKDIIREGRDPVDPERLPSRSEWLFSVCCEMARYGCADEVMVAVITDSANSIAESVLGKGRMALRYAVRQVEKAKAVAAEPSELLEMNEKHAVVKYYGGKFRIACKKTHVEEDRLRYEFVSRADFLAQYEHRKIQVGETPKGKAIMMTLAEWWLEHPLHREFEQVVFKPEQEVADTHFNLWEGFAVKPQPGELHLSFLAHVRDNICNGDEKAYEYLTQWMARTVQFPAQPGEVAVVMVGQKGTGKGQFANHFGKLFGLHYKTITNPRHLVGNFNGHLENCLVLFSDEATPTENAKQGGILKGLITEPKILIERKSVNAELHDNYIHLLMASNEMHAVHYTPDERRYFVVKTGTAQRKNRAYFAQIKRDMEAGGYGNLLDYLLGVSLTDWDHTDMPMTKAAQEQLMASIGKNLAVLLDIAYKGVLPGTTVQKRGNPSLMCLNTTAALFGVHPTTLRNEWEAKGYITRAKPYQHVAWENPDGEVVGSATQMLPGAKALPRLMYEILALDELRRRLDDYAPHGWPDDGNQWRFEEDEVEEGVDEEAPF